MKFIITCAALMMILLYGVAYISTQPSSVYAQSVFTYLQPQSSVSGCVWPQGVTFGTAVCPVTQSNGGVNMAFASNGGPFQLVGAGMQGPKGDSGTIGPAGATGVGFKIGTVVTFNVVCPKGSGTVSGGFTITGCKQTITAIQ